MPVNSIIYARKAQAEVLTISGFLLGSSDSEITTQTIKNIYSEIQKIADNSLMKGSQVEKMSDE